MLRQRPLRNIGISAHVDSGKTTLTERILFYTGKIHKMEEVGGKSGVGATMDSDSLEIAMGISIQSAATNVEWHGPNETPVEMTIIDTPGHVDFTIEVERSLRVLDGAILVLCAAGGVQSQAMTVDRQMRRYNVPCLAFVNKMDLAAADFDSVVQQLDCRLGHFSVVLQLPIGTGSGFKGVIDLVKMKAVYNAGQFGEQVQTCEIPVELEAEAEAGRKQLLETLALVSDDFAQRLSLVDGVSEADIYHAIRTATLRRDLTPVLCGSAYKYMGVQSLLDAICHYLPEPEDCVNVATSDDQEIILSHDQNASLCAYAFKITETNFGQLTYCRVYQGSLRQGMTVFNSRTGKTQKIGRLMRMHAKQQIRIREAVAGEIVVLFGVDCANGDTFCDENQHYSLQSMHIPEPVVSLSVDVKDQENQSVLSKALRRFSREDPTFKVAIDSETKATIISGMGRLHLEIYIERLRSDFDCAVDVSEPQICYRESITKAVRFVTTHKKQSGGRGQYAKIEGTLEPSAAENFEFEDKTVGGVIPKVFFKSIRKGCEFALQKGSLIAAPVINVRVTVDNGKTASEDSNEKAFFEAGRKAVRANMSAAEPIVLEPQMQVEVYVPVEFQGVVLGDIVRRRGRVTRTEVVSGGQMTIGAEVPLAEMLSYGDELRSATRGQGGFSMNFDQYARCPTEIQKELVLQFGS